MEKLALHGGKPVRTAPLAPPDAPPRFGQEEIEAATRVIKSGILWRNNGVEAKTFEEEFSARFHVKHALAVSHGTAAIHTALAALEVGPGDEVITSPITDMGTISPIVAQGAAPVFADLDPLSMNLDPDDVAKRVSPRTKAIIAVHLAGYPADVYPLLEIAGKHGIFLIEDCAQAMLAEYDGRLVGTIGHLGCFSINNSKHISCGEGGVVIGSDDDIMRRARLFADKGYPRGQKGMNVQIFGLNYRLTDLQAAIARVQLEKAAAIVGRRRLLGDRLVSLLQGIPGLFPPPTRPGTRHSFWFFALRVLPEFGASTDNFAQALAAEGIPCAPHYIGIPLYRYDIWQRPVLGRQLQFREHECPNAENALAYLAQIPWNQAYTDDAPDDIANAIRKIADNAPSLSPPSPS